MPVFDLTLKGFRGNVDEATKWVLADDKQTLDDWLIKNNLKTNVSSIVQLGEHTNEYGFADGLDVVLYKMSTGFVCTWYGMFKIKETIEAWKIKEYNKKSG